MIPYGPDVDVEFFIKHNDTILWFCAMVPISEHKTEQITFSFRAQITEKRERYPAVYRQLRIALRGLTDASIEHAKLEVTGPITIMCKDCMVECYEHGDISDLEDDPQSGDGI